MLRDHAVLGKFELSPRPPKCIFSSFFFWLLLAVLRDHNLMAAWLCTGATPSSAHGPYCWDLLFAAAAACKTSAKPLTSMVHFLTDGNEIFVERMGKNEIIMIVGRTRLWVPETL